MDTESTYYSPVELQDVQIGFRNKYLLWNVSLQDDGKPCLGHVMFFVEVLETLYQFMEHSGHPINFQEHYSSDSVATRAANILISLLPTSDVSFNLVV